MYMTSLRQIIRENLLLEKKIGQISSKMEFSFNFLVDRSNHAYLRRIRTNIEDSKAVASILSEELVNCVRLSNYVYWYHFSTMSKNSRA